MPHVAPARAVPEHDQGMDDKYDEAIAWLREKDRMKGSYYEEVACLMEELLGRIYELETWGPKRRRSRPREPTEHRANPPLIVIPGGRR